MNGAVTVPAGWYPTANRQVMRWWDGRAWTDQLLTSGRPMTIDGLRHRAQVITICWVVLGVMMIMLGCVIALLNPFSLLFVPVGIAAIVAVPLRARKDMRDIDLPPRSSTPPV